MSSYFLLLVTITRACSIVSLPKAVYADIASSDKGAGESHVGVLLPVLEQLLQLQRHFRFQLPQ